MTKYKLLNAEYNQDNKNDALYSNSDPEYDVLFRAQVEEGLRESEIGEFITHDEAKRLSLDHLKKLNLKSDFLHENNLD